MRLGFDLRTPRPVTVYLDGVAGEESVGRGSNAGTEDRGLPAAAFKDSEESGLSAAPAKPLFLAPDIAALDAAPPAAPSAPAGGGRRLNVIVTGVEGELAEVRKGGGDAWAPAKRGMVLHEDAEFRTGAEERRAVHHPARPDVLPRQPELAQGPPGRRQREEGEDGGRPGPRPGARGPGEDPAGPTGPSTRQPVRIEEAGLEHDTVIRSPNSALALRGTKVSLFEQPGFAPEAISLTGRAVYTNTRGLRGAVRRRGYRAAVRGDQTSAVQQAAANAPPPAGHLPGPHRLREPRDRPSSSSAAASSSATWSSATSTSATSASCPARSTSSSSGPAGRKQQLNDLNLAVFSPAELALLARLRGQPALHRVADAEQRQVRADAARRNYPRNSPSGGQISKNSVGPDGLELANWPKNYPAGTYRVVVYNLLDAKPPPAQTIDPVTYTIDVFLNGKKLINTYTGSVGLLQTSMPCWCRCPRAPRRRHRRPRRVPRECPCPRPSGAALPPRPRKRRAPPGRAERPHFAARRFFPTRPPRMVGRIAACTRRPAGVPRHFYDRRHGAIDLWTAGPPNASGNPAYVPHCATVHREQTAGPRRE